MKNLQESIKSTIFRIVLSDQIFYALIKSKDYLEVMVYA